MDKREDMEPGSNEKSTGTGEKGDSLAMEVSAGDNSSGTHDTEEKSLKVEVKRLKELMVELKGNLIVLNRGIVARQDTIDQLTKRKQKLLEAGGECKLTTSTKSLSASNFRKTNAQNDLMDNDRAMEAIELFPEEVWELILGKLTDPKDMRNCSASCQLFDKILHPLKSNFLFLGVFPNLCPYLDNKLILNCRRVCKGWNEGVDNFVENHPALLPYDKMSWNPRYTPPTRNGLFLLKFSNDRGDLRELNFLEKMRHHPRNPFVGRAVSIQIVHHYAVFFDDSDDEYEDIEEGHDNDQDDLEQVAIAHDGADDDDEDNWETEDESDLDDNGIDLPFSMCVLPNFLRINEAIGMSVKEQKNLFWQALLNFLKVFGKHIWYLSIQCYKEGAFINNADKVFEFLTKTIFVLAPNLRGIHIYGHLPTTDPLMLGPIPVPPKLEALKFERRWERSGTEAPVTGSVIETMIHASFQQLKLLHVDWATWKHIFKSNLEWTNLTELDISSDGSQRNMEVEDLVPSRMPQLRKIGLAHPHGFADEFEEVIKIINGLSASTNLHVLRLFGGFRREQIIQAPDCLFANPNLKTLEMDRVIFHGDYSFLFRFPFLENLVICFDTESRLISSEALLEREVLELEEYMYARRVYECEIWEMLPRLKVFTVGRDVYTRECYERITRKKEVFKK